MNEGKLYLKFEIESYCFEGNSSEVTVKILDFRINNNEEKKNSVSKRLLF